MADFDSKPTPPSTPVPAPIPRGTVTIHDRISSGRVYLEPALYSIAQSVAEADRKTFSNWARTLIIQELIRRGKIPNDLMVRLLAA